MWLFKFCVHALLYLQVAAPTAYCRSMVEDQPAVPRAPKSVKKAPKDGSKALQKWNELSYLEFQRKEAGTSDTMFCKCCREFDEMARQQKHFGKAFKAKGDAYVTRGVRVSKHAWEAKHVTCDIHSYCRVRYNIKHEIDLESSCESLIIAGNATDVLLHELKKEGHISEIPSCVPELIKRIEEQNSAAEKSALQITSAAVPETKAKRKARKRKSSLMTNPNIELTQDHAQDVTLPENANTNTTSSLSSHDALPGYMNEFLKRSPNWAFNTVVDTVYKNVI